MSNAHADSHLLARSLRPPSSPVAVRRTRGFRDHRGSSSALCIGLAIAFGAVVLGCSDEGATAGESDPVADPVIMKIDAEIQKRAIDKAQPQWRVRLEMPPKVEFDPAKKYFWKLQTNQGDIVFRMFPEVAPLHVGATFYLTRLGFYDTLGFHRVIQGFMAQGGDPLGTGTGTPGFRYYGEFDPKLVHDGPGVLSMANAGPGTDGSQFFVTFAATPHLNGLHTVFGKAESKASLETIRKMEALSGPGPQNRPTSPIVIERASILIE